MIIDNMKDFIKLAKEHGVNKNPPSDIEGDCWSLIQDDYGWLQKEVDKLIEQGVKYSIFTVIDGVGQKYYIVNGLWRINRLGYIVIKLPDIEINEEAL